jgi:hypothetical protein
MKEQVETKRDILPHVSNVNVSNVQCRCNCSIHGEKKFGWTVDARSGWANRRISRNGEELEMRKNTGTWDFGGWLMIYVDWQEPRLSASVTYTERQGSARGIGVSGPGGLGKGPGVHCTTDDIISRNSAGKDLRGGREVESSGRAILSAEARTGPGTLG